MKKKRIVTLLFVISCVVFSSGVFGQIYDPASRSQFFPYKNPAPLSPWLELERATNSSELDSYHQFVKPRLEMQRLIETQQSLLFRQRESQMQIKQRVEGLELKQQTTAAPTGRQVKFFDYGRFYPRKARK